MAVKLVVWKVAKTVGLMALRTAVKKAVWMALSMVDFAAVLMAGWMVA